MNFRAGVYSGSTCLASCSTVSPHCATYARLSLLTRSARISSSSLSSSRTSSAGNTTPCPSSLPSCCSFSASCGAALSPARRCLFLMRDERREAPLADIPSGYAWCRSVPSSAGRRPTRTTSSPVYATATSTLVRSRPAAIPVSPFAVPAGRRGSGSTSGSPCCIRV